MINTILYYVLVIIVHIPIILKIYTYVLNNTLIYTHYDTLDILISVIIV